MSTSNLIEQAMTNVARELLLGPPREAKPELRVAHNHLRAALAAVQQATKCASLRL